jgi:butyrate kinase
MKILCLNPGSTSTKIAVFEDGKQVFITNIKHSAEAIAKYKSVIDQYKVREEIILKTLADNGIDKSEFCAIVGRGGLVKPIHSGTYEVNEALLADLRASVGGDHASNLVSR